MSLDPSVVARTQFAFLKSGVATCWLQLRFFFLFTAIVGRSPKIGRATALTSHSLRISQG
jgi:hypothetical protein